MMTQATQPGTRHFGCALIRRAAGATFGLALLTQLAGCFETKVDRSELGDTPGLTAPCYTADLVTRGIGICRNGFNINYADETGNLQSVCFAEITPVSEVCDGLDNDCNGLTDDAGVCAEEAITQLESRTGNVNVVNAEDRVGPAMISKPTWGAMFDCSTMDPAECAVAFVAANRTAYGLVKPFQELRLSRTEGDRTHATVHFDQFHHGVAMSDGWASVTISAGDVVSIHARVMPSPPVEPPTPAINEATAQQSLPAGATAIVARGPTYFVDVLPDEDPADPQAQVKRYTSTLAYRFEYKTSDGTLTQSHVAADDGRVLRTDMLDIEAVVLDGPIVDKATGAAPAAEIVSYLRTTQQDLIDLATHAALIADDKINGGIPLSTNATTGSCARANVLGFFNATDGVHNCASSDIDSDGGRSTYRHELGHWIVKQSWSGSYKEQGPNATLFSATYREHNSMVDYFSNFGAETLECYQDFVKDRDDTDCDFYHDADSRDYDELFTRDDFDASLAATAANSQYLLRYSDNRVVGSALNEIRKRWEDTYGEDEALSRMAAIFYGSFSKLPSGDKALQYLDYYLAVQQTCVFRFADPGLTLTTLKDGHAYTFSDEDCGALAQTFIEVGVAEPCSVLFAEVCDGIDNDCDGYTDNGPAVQSDDSLTRWCYSGDRDVAGVGECQSGLQRCVDGAFDATCVGEVLPTAEICDLKDNDCDRQTDEYVQTEFAYDGDTDRVPGPGGHIFACDGDEDAGYVPYTPTTPLDCNDRDGSIFPGANEQCGNGIDDNCNGLVDEGCICDPTVQATRFCGPVRTGCANQAFDVSRISACTLGDAASCRVGASRCEPDPVDGRLRWSTVCYGAALGAPETCDGRDNNCDGSTDNNIADFGANGIPCGYEDAGTLTCSGGNVLCSGAPAWPAGNCQFGQAPNGETPFNKTSLAFSTPDLNFSTGGEEGDGIDVTGSVSVAGVGTTSVTASWNVSLREQDPDHTAAAASGNVILASVPVGCSVTDIYYYNANGQRLQNSTALVSTIVNTGSKTWTWTDGTVSAWTVWGDDGDFVYPSDDDYAGTKIYFRGPTYRFCCNLP